MLRTYEDLLVNCFQAKGGGICRPIEGLKLGTQVVTRYLYGCTTFNAAEIRIYAPGRVLETRGTRRTDNAKFAALFRMVSKRLKKARTARLLPP